MRIAICEDNKTEAEEISYLIQQSVTDIGEICDEPEIYLSAEEFLRTDTFYDIIFLDCLLPKISGTELAMKLRKSGVNSEIVFITAYREYAVDGYECEGLRYLLKPIKAEKVTEALLAYKKKHQFNDLINLKKSGKPFFAKPSDILYIEITENKTLVRLVNATVNSDMSLSKFEKMIKYPTIVRSSRQFIINIQHIKNINGRLVTMNNGERVIVSRRHIGNFNNLYKKYITSDYCLGD